ncbi:MAG: mechanosensitive ion channel family protein [Salaquimonas sp.]
MKSLLSSRFQWGLLTLFLVSGIFLNNPSHAQNASQSLVTQAQQTESLAGAQIKPPSPNDVRELMRLLDDPAIRNWLVEGSRFAGEAENANQTVSLRESLTALSAATSARIKQLEFLWRDIGSAPQMIAAGWSSQLSQTETLRTIIYAVIFLFIGGALEWLYVQYTKYRLMQIEFFVPKTLRLRTRSAIGRLLLNLGGITCFAIGSIGAFLFFTWPELVKDIVLDFLLTVLAGRLLYTVSKSFFSPRLKNLRLVPMKNTPAKQTHRWTVALGLVGLFSLFASNLFRQTFAMIQDDVPQTAILSVGIATNTIWAMLALVAIWNVRLQFAAPQNEPSFRGKMVNPWPAYLSLIVLASLILWVLNAQALMGSVLILGLFFPLVKLTNAWINNLYDQAEGIDELHGEQFTRLADVKEGQTAKVSEASDSQIVESDEPENTESDSGVETSYTYKIYASISKRIARFALVALTIMGLVYAWGISLFELSASQSVGGIAFDIVTDTIFAVLLADLVWHWAKLVIDRRLADYTPPQDGQAPGPEARMATLLPLLRMILMITLLTVVALSVLTSFGVNIGPLLAGAGVLGVAIGFGAQALVRDVVSGIFFLIDDAFRIGEYIEIDDLRGTVESMSIRSLRVRHHRGMVHTIPFGELKSLTNYSRDWVIMKLEFRVPFNTDLKLVKKIVKKIGVELQENEVYGKAILQTLKSQGVRRMEEFNMVVGVKFMAKPGEQWLIRRDAYQKVRDAFEANGIGFAERNVKVEVLGDPPMNDATRKAVIGAAQNAVEQQLPPVPIKDEP